MIMKKLNNILDRLTNVFIGIGLAHIALHFIGNIELSSSVLIGYSILVPLAILMQTIKGFKINKK